MTLRSSAIACGFETAEIFAAIRRMLDAHDQTFTAGPERIDWPTEVGDVAITATKAGVRFDLTCPGLSDLVDLRSAIDAHLAEVGAAGLNWSGDRPASPPNFRTARVVEVADASPSFVRMTLEGADIARFATGGLHFRLLRPTDPTRPPVWPSMSPRGTVDWPTGEDALIQKVYTTRFFRDGRLVFDIFRHAGGLTADWAQTRPLGQTIGLLGPGGGWGPEGGRLFLAGDETAAPAILRMLERLPPHVTGAALIMVSDEGDRIAAAAPRGVEVIWLLRGKDSLCAAAQRHAERVRADQYWFAASKPEADEMRSFFATGMGLSRSRFRVAAYWS